MTEIFILSLIQGITEFLPISSSSHLILTSEYLDLENQNLSIDVSLHIGSFFAVLIYFYKDLINFFENRLLFLKIIVSSIPVILVGFFLVKSGTIEKIRILEAILELLAKQAYHSSPFTSKMRQMGWVGSAI